MPRLLLFLPLACWAAPLHAQTRFYDRTVSVTVGLGDNDFSYTAGDTSFAYAFDAVFPTVTISGEESFFSLGIGTQGADPATGQPALMMVEAVMEGGSHVYLFRRLGDAPVGGFLPIRTTFDFRYVGPTDRPVEDQIDDLALVAGALGVGLGTAIRPAYRRRPTVIASWLSSFGVLTDIASFPETDTRLLRTTDVHVEIKFERLFSSALGLTIGYSYRSQRWGDRSPEAPRDVADALRHPRDLPRRSAHHLFRTGINF